MVELPGTNLYMFLSNETNGEGISMYALFQFLEPVLDNDHAGARRVRISSYHVFEHQEPLTVKRHVVGARGKRVRYLRRTLSPACPR